MNPPLLLLLWARARARILTLAEPSRGVAIAAAAAGPRGASLAEKRRRPKFKLQRMKNKFRKVPKNLPGRVAAKLT